MLLPFWVTFISKSDQIVAQVYDIYTSKTINGDFMMIKHLCIITALALLAGCSSTIDTTKSGFLPDYRLLTPSDKYPDTNLYVSDELKNGALKNVSTIYLPHFEVWIKAKEQKFLYIHPQKVAKLSTYMRDQLQAKLSPNFNVVLTQPAKRDDSVLTITGAFTEVNFSETSMGVRDFIPVKLVYNAGKTAYLAATEQTEALTKVSLESAFYIGENNKPALMMSAHKEVELVLQQNGGENIKAVKGILDNWIDNFVNAINKAKN